MIVTAGLRRQLLTTTYTRPPGFPYWTAGILIKGSVRITAEDGSYAVVKAPSVSLVPPDFPYHIRFDGKGDRWVNGWVIFSPPPHWYRWFNFPVVFGSSLGFRLPSTRGGRFVLRALKQGLETFSQASVERDALIENLLEKLLILSHSVNPQASVARPDARITEAMNRIHSDYARPWTVDQLAKEVHLSASRFSHLFCNATGLGPMRYLEEHRVERAKGLLLSTNMPIGLIANEVGYENPFHFSARFRAVVGQSPRAFRLKPALEEKE